MSNKKVVPQEGIHNQLIPGTIIKGDIFTEGNIKIDGKLFGNIETKGRIVIGDTGLVEGEIKCDNAQISGTIKGEIICSDLLSLKATAKFSGNIITSKLSIEPGAQFSGTCKMPDSSNEENKNK